MTIWHVLGGWLGLSGAAVAVFALIGWRRRHVSVEPTWREKIEWRDQ